MFNIENNYQINQDNDFIILLNEGRYFSLYLK